MNFELTILGSSSGAPVIDRYQTAQYLVIRNEHVLIDCGEATQMQLMKYGLSYMKINNIFISHLHADHYIGLIGLINTMSLNHRLHELHIYCPEGLEEIINVQLKHSAVVLDFPLLFHFTRTDENTVIIDNMNFSVASIPLKHRLPVTGFIFREKNFLRKIRKETTQNKNIPLKAFNYLKRGENYNDDEGNIFLWQNYTEDPPPPRSFAFITDTLYYPEIVPFIKGVDLLYHEATFMEDQIDNSRERYHSTNIEAAKIALEANVKKLIIGHFSTRYKDLNIILEQARKIFPETYLATDGAKFKVPYK